MLAWFDRYEKTPPVISQQRDLNETALRGYPERPSHFKARRGADKHGRYWTRTSDFYDVNVALYQLS